MAEIPRATYFPVSPDYLRTLQIPQLRGRFITSADTLNSEPVVVTDSILARTYFPNREAIGQCLTIPHWGRQQAEGGARRKTADSILLLPASG